MKCKPLSRVRVYVLAGLIVSMVLTVVLSVYGTHVTGKKRMSCTKGIVFAATAFLVWLTVLAMITARRALSEALLAGLLEFIFGFALLVELDDFM
jgi:high-affinity Fe2+/Pb2+ permease